MAGNSSEDEPPADVHPFVSLHATNETPTFTAAILHIVILICQSIIFHTNITCGHFADTRAPEIRFLRTAH